MLLLLFLFIRFRDVAGAERHAVRDAQHTAETRFYTECSKQESRAVASKPRDAANVLFGLKFADSIHYKFKSSQASKARLQSSKHTGAKQNLIQNGHSRSFKVMCFGVSGKAIREY